MSKPENPGEGMRMLPDPGQTSQEPILPVITIMENSSLVIDPSDVRVGDNLASIDILMVKKAEKAAMIPRLREIYGIDFTDDISGVPLVSFTAKKGLLTDTEHNVYFLKEKPFYTLSDEQLNSAATLQTELAKRLPYIPQIIRTRDESPYAKVQEKTLFLTPYIKGDLYMGRIAQSLSCAEALGEMHAVIHGVIPAGSRSINSTEEAVKFIDMTRSLNFPDTELQRRTLDRMAQLATKYSVTQEGQHGWIHGDFAPYNTVFKRDAVIAVNDFDNTSYGPLARDVAVTLLDHCGINYAGPTSSMRPPIRTALDTERMEVMLQAYEAYSGVDMQQLKDLPNQISSIWLEYMALGLLRGDFSLRHVDISLSFCDTLNKSTNILMKKYEKI